MRCKILLRIEVFVQTWTGNGFIAGLACTHVVTEFLTAAKDEHITQFESNFFQLEAAESNQHACYWEIMLLLYKTTKR